MAYQNVGTPRFYIDHINHQKEYGVLDVMDEFNSEISGLTYPSNYKKIELPDGQYKAVNYSMVNTTFKNINWAGFIGHNIGDNFKIEIEAYNPETLNITDITNKEAVINFDDGYCESGFSIIKNSSGDYFAFEEDATYFRFMLTTSSGNTFLEDNLTEVDIGSLCFGIYYDMPHSPELDLTMTIENDGYSSITTQGGAHLSDIRYLGAPMWGTGFPPWTIGGNTLETRNGRRVWSLSFNYLSDSDLFASNYMSTTYLESGSDTGYNSDDIDNDNFYYTLENDNSFHAQVLNKIGNGQRFIFQPDNTNNQPDQFAICQLNQDSLKIDQIANGAYNIRMEIREVW